MIKSRTQRGLEGQKLYLDLMKKVLTFSFGGDHYILNDTLKYPPVKKMVYRRLTQYLLDRQIYLVRKKPFDPKIREEGRDHPLAAFTMIGIKRLDNIQFCTEDIISRGIPGDLIETGVWRGGAVIFMRAILKAHGINDRKVWVADSFEGLPTPNAEAYPADAASKFHLMDHLAVSLEQVKANFKEFNLLDEQVCFLKGWFKDTLPKAPITNLSLMRLDGDMYESTMDALVNLYPKLSPGGFVIIDDYWDIKSCRKAVDDYRSENGIVDEIHTIDWTGIFWMKSK